MKYVIALAMLAGLGATAAPAQASAAWGPAVSAPAAVQLVAQGCGPRGVRDRYGRCRPAYAPPPRQRMCPPGLHMTPYGCRRNY